MEIRITAVGKTVSEPVDALLNDYVSRIGRYVRFSFRIIPDVKNASSLSPQELKNREGEAILSTVEPGDILIMLDEKGFQPSSREFAAWLEKKAASGVRRLVFAVGGAYGFSDAVYARAQEKLSLSRMTMPHQLVRAVFAEQLYRAFSIIAGAPYHHD